MPASGVRCRDDVAGHAEVQQEERSVGRRDQPLPSTLRLSEAMTAECPIQLPSAHVPEDPRIGHEDLLDEAPRRAGGEAACEVLDIWELGHECYPITPTA